MEKTTGWVSVNKVGLIYRINEGFTDILGYSLSDAFGHNISDLLIPEACRERHIREFRDLTRSRGETVRLQYLPVIHKSGEVMGLPFRIKTVPSEFPGDGGKREIGSVEYEFSRHGIVERDSERAVRKLGKIYLP